MDTSEQTRLDQRLLSLLDENKDQSISSLDLAEIFSVDHQKVIGALKSISTKAAFATGDPKEFLETHMKDVKKLELTKEAEMIVGQGFSHEVRLFNYIPEDLGIEQAELMNKFQDMVIGKVGFSTAMRNKWICMDKETKKIKRNVPQVEDRIFKTLKAIKEGSYSPVNPNFVSISELNSRKLVTTTVVKYFELKKGPKFSLTMETPETDLTMDLLQTGEWKLKKFKDYNYKALGVPAIRGHLHPLLKVREQFRQIFLEMGFSEMPTNNFVESSFWNFDVLVVPQAHPARDSQDTFFIKDPETCTNMEDKEFVTRVQTAHSGSKDKSWPKGYQYDWSEQESVKNVLRTHTTAVTARMLYKLANQHKKKPKNSPFQPAKLFSIDRVFRNETLDATHLAEFNQVEGVVLDKDLTLGDLMGVLQVFFEKLGIGNLRFKPAYNPYTEPSMEIFSFHEGLNKWVEVGNSGVFRPEMLNALGLPDDVTAIAWGLSLERPTMIKYKIDNIRELVGHKVNLDMVHNSPLCLF